MSDDISIPDTGPARTAYTHSYRSRNAGLDTGTKRMALAAGGLLLLLAGGVAVWTFAGRHHASGGDGVPTIEADTRPLRIKPDAQADAGAGLADPGAATSGSATSAMAPQAERPDPSAIAGRQPAPAAIAPAAAPQAAATLPAARPALLPAAPTAAKPSGKIMVQLAAVGSEKDATSEWQRLTRKMPELLKDHELTAQKADGGGKTFWRVRTGGFRDVADAAQFCKAVKEKGGSCTLAAF